MNLDQNSTPDKDAADTLEQASQRGRLPPEARRAVVELMRQGVVMADSKRLVFDALCQHQEIIRDHLADMYLRLQIDDAAGLALLLQQQDDENAEQEDVEVPRLINRRVLSLYDSLLLLVLRRYYLDRETAGDKQIQIDIEQVEERLLPFLPLSANQSKDRKRLNGAIENMKKRRILSPVRGEESRLEILPVIRYVVSAQMLEQLLSEYRRIAQDAAGVNGDADD